MADNRKDITSPALARLSWEPAQATESLLQVVARVIANADSAISWYLSAKRSKRRWARFLRLGAILLTASSGILPMILQIGTTPDGPTPFAPAWSSVLLALAILLIALDRFFGFSSGWIRYISAELQIRQARQVFELDWEATHATLATPPTIEQLQSALLACKAFTERVNAILAEETAKWVAEFEEALKQIDESARSVTAVPATGSITVSVDNGDAVDAPGWTVWVDHGPPRRCSGKAAGMTGLLPGEHVVHVLGSIGGKSVRSEAVVSVQAGAIAAAAVTLS